MPRASLMKKRVSPSASKRRSPHSGPNWAKNWLTKEGRGFIVRGRLGRSAAQAVGACVHKTVVWFQSGSRQMWCGGRMSKLPLLLLPFLALSPLRATSPDELFATGNLHAWCAVPFDAKKRGPEERAEMLQKLGFQHFVYDWR